MALDAAVKLTNPLSAEYSVMRTSLVPGLLETVAYNHNRGSLDLRLFETGKVYRAAGETPAEHWQFAAVLSGHAADQTWRSGARNADFFDGKAVAEALLGGFEFDECTWSRPEQVTGFVETTLLHPGKSAIAQCGGATVLLVGELHPRLKEALDLKRDAVLLCASFAALQPNLAKLPAPQQAPQFPAIARDLALVVDATTAAADIEQAIAKRAKSMLAGIRLFDVYEGERIGAGKRSLAYQLRFSAPDRTLTDAEVNPLIEKVLADLKEKLGVEIRQ
jgi:phenylalanyl-tRNA synthetase beta chain